VSWLGAIKAKSRVITPEWDARRKAAEVINSTESHCREYTIDSYRSFPQGIGCSIKLMFHQLSCIS
jgi:hypothetical protein